MVKIFADVNADGECLGFYPDDVWPEDKRPASAIEIAEDLWHAWISDPSQRLVGGQLVAGPQPTPTIDDVVAECSRRLALGFDYDFGDERGVHHVGTTEEDMRGWDEVSKATQAMIALGVGSQQLSIVTNTGPAVITAVEWQQILIAATLARQPIWAASFVLQAMDPIPADFASDIYWP